jgi:hypothetical protein
MGRLLKARSKAGRQSWPRPEDFRVNAIGWHPQPARPAGTSAIKPAGPQVEIGIVGHTYFGENGSTQTTGGIEVETKPVARNKFNDRFRRNPVVAGYPGKVPSPNPQRPLALAARTVNCSLRGERERPRGSFSRHFEVLDKR